MKKILLSLFAFGVLLFLVSCGTKKDENILRIGVGPAPMSSIVEEIKDDFEKLGYKLVITNFADYEQVNVALNEKEIDLNFAQHEPFMKGFNTRKNGNLVKIKGIYSTEIYLFSEKYRTVEEIENNSLVGIMNDPFNLARTLTFMKELELISFSDTIDPLSVTLDDITNPKNFDFKLFSAGTIGSNYKGLGLSFMYPTAGVQAGLKTSDAITKEINPKSDYDISLVAREDNKDSTKVQDFIKVVTSDKVRTYLEKNYPTYKVVF